MIEINLLPGGGGRKASSRGGGGGIRIDLRAVFAGLSGRFGDKYLLAAIGSTAVAAVVIGMLYTRQTYREATLTAREHEAVADSTKLAIALAEKIKAEATRDTALRQINVIRSIDEDRYVWPHVLDEVSRALTPYTWLTTIAFNGEPQGTANIVGGPQAGAKVDTLVTRDRIGLRFIGQTVDIQSLTRFMRLLEASPYISNVSLERSEMVIEGNKEVTQFYLTAAYTRPDPATVRRVPLPITGPLASRGN